MAEGFPGGTKRKALLVALSVAAVAAVGYLTLHDRAAPPTPAPAVPPAKPAPETAATPKPAIPEQAEATPESAAETAAKPVPTPGAPGFDLVRVEPDGSAVVAGTAEPGSDVTIYADAVPLATAEADAQGNFVAIFRAEPSSRPQALTLGAANPEGETKTSDDVVMLLPAAPPASTASAQPATTEEAAASGAAEVPATQPGSEVAAETAVTAPAPAAETAIAPAPPATPEAAPTVAATAIVRADEVEVTPASGAAARDVTLASISYAEAGEVTLAGLGTAGAVLRAYVDDSLAHEGRVGDDGRWSMELADVAGGIYRLRIDQLGPDGTVASRVETPFQRDFPRAPPPRPGAPAGVASVTVQPGNNLWTLARERYGSGMMYTQIFTANRELIRNPDLIYPGQIFNMPAMDAAN